MDQTVVSVIAIRVSSIALLVVFDEIVEIRQLVVRLPGGRQTILIVVVVDRKASVTITVQPHVSIVTLFAIGQLIITVSSIIVIIVVKVAIVCCKVVKELANTVFRNKLQRKKKLLEQVHKEKL